MGVFGKWWETFIARMQNGFLSIKCMTFSFLWSGNNAEQAIVRIIWSEELGAH